MTTFNRATQRARISASWPHDQSYYRFARQSGSIRQFAEPSGANLAADIVIGILAMIGLAVVLAWVGGWL